MNGPAATASAPARRADAGTVRLGARDAAGLVLCGDVYGAPYDLLAAFLVVRPDRLRGIVTRWRSAGYGETGRLGAGPAWCWLTRAGLGVTGQPYTYARPAVARLAHIRAVLAVRLSLEASAALRSRIIARFTELETERTQINERLTALDRATGQRDDPGLLDSLPMLGDILAGAPPSLQTRLFAALGLELIYNKEDHQVHHLRHHHPQHTNRAGRHHRRQRTTHHPGRPGRIGPFFTTTPECGWSAHHHNQSGDGTAVRGLRRRGPVRG